MGERSHGEENYDLQPWFWRTRYKMAPIYALLALGLSGLGLRMIPDQRQATLVMVLAGGALGLLVRARYGTGKRKDRAMATFLYLVITCAALVLLAIRLEWWPVTYTYAGLAVAFTLLVILWRSDRRNQRTEIVEAELRRWPTLAKKIHLDGVKRGATRTTETGRRIRLWWAPGTHTLDGVKHQLRALEGALGVKYQRGRFENVVDDDGMIDPNSVWFVENTKSPILKAPVPFQAPTMTSVYDPLHFAMIEDGTEGFFTIYDVKWGGRHTLVGGQTGSGKSGLYDLIFAESSKCQDLVRWGCDPKGGMTLQQWAPLFDWLVTDQKGAEAQLTAIKEILIRRSEYAASKGWRVWKASPKRPLIVLTVEECAEVFGPFGGIVELADSIARMGRAAGVLLQLATQYPTADAVSSSQLMKNIGRRFCFSVVDSLAQRVIIPGSLDKFDATTIPTGPKWAGTFYMSDGGEINPLSGRVRYITEEQIRELVLEIGDTVSVLDRLSAQAATEATSKFGENSYDNRKIWLVEDLPPLDGPDDDDEEDDDDDDEPEVPTVDRVDPEEVPDVNEQLPSMGLTVAELAESLDPVERDRLIAEYLLEQTDDASVTPEMALRRLDAALDAAGPDGIGAAQLGVIAGRKKTWVYDQLERQGLDGHVIPADERGRHRRPPGWTPRVEAHVG